MTLRTISCWIMAGLAAVVLVASAAGADAPSTAPADAAVQRISKLVDQLNDLDPQLRRRATLLVLNQAGDALKPLKASLGRDDLGPETRRVLQKAIVRVKVRAAKLQQSETQDRWSHRTLVSEYERVGHKDARWDALVRQGMDSFAHYTVEDRTRAHELLRQAMAIGCDDPLVLYLEARSLVDTQDAKRADVAEHLHRAAKAMAASQYDAPRKMLALFRSFQYSPDAPENAPDEIIKWGIESAKDEQVPRQWIVETFEGLLKGLTPIMGREPAFNKIYPSYQKALPESALPLRLKGVFCTQWAWDARGNGWANTVTPEGWRLFGQRLDMAQQALEQGSKLDPSDGQIGAQMITVKMGQSDRDGIEEWYRRAMEADPDNYTACSRKMQCLWPRWYGSHEAMIEFGRQCVQTDNYFATIPFMLVRAHADIAQESGDPVAYLRQPDVWADISQVYENALVVYPTTFNRCRFGLWAARCGHWEVTNRQFNLVGDDPDPRAFPNRQVYDQLREHARRVAGT